MTIRAEVVQTAYNSQRKHIVLTMSQAVVSDVVKQALHRVRINRATCRTGILIGFHSTTRGGRDYLKAHGLEPRELYVTPIIQFNYGNYCFPILKYPDSNVSLKQHSHCDDYGMLSEDRNERFIQSQDIKHVYLGTCIKNPDSQKEDVRCDAHCWGGAGTWT